MELFRCMWFPWEQNPRHFPDMQKSAGRRGYFRAGIDHSFHALLPLFLPRFRRPF